MHTYTLFECIALEKVKEVRYLAAMGANWNVTAGGPNTVPLGLAVLQKKWEIIKILLSSGTDPNYHWDGKGCAGEVAVRSDEIQDAELDIVRLLLDHGANPNAQMVGAQALDFLLEHKPSAVQFIDLVKQRGGKPHPGNGLQMGMKQAVMENDVDTVVKKLNAGLDVDTTYDQDMTGLHMACLAGRPALVDLFIQRGANINRTAMYAEETPLTLAAHGNHVAICRTLIKAGARMEPLEGERSALGSAALNGSLDAVKTLIECGANINSIHRTPGRPELSGRNALFMCLASNMDGVKPIVKVHTVEYLVQKGINVNATEDEGFSALHSVAEMDDRSSIPATYATLLLKHGANPDITNKKGETPLLSAIRNQNPKTAELFLKAGASPFTLNAKGMSPLGQAAAIGYIPTAEILLKSGVRVHATLEGETLPPLMCAIVNEHKAMVEWLLKKGADVNAPVRVGDEEAKPLITVVEEQVVNVTEEKFAEWGAIMKMVLERSRQLNMQGGRTQKVEVVKGGGKKFGGEVGEKKKKKGVFKKLFS
ncbi:hypothetical protein HDV00_004351 [Rhizophlyctis rosea]|nr:hypothetical protein HDV00_004351 [Rhizophlyctis rosea]